MTGVIFSDKNKYQKDKEGEEVVKEQETPTVDDEGDNEPESLSMDAA